METDNSTFLFVLIAHYQQKEFVGQKAINQDVAEEVAGDSTTAILDHIWIKAKTLIIREILVDGDNFSWAESESPDRSEIGNFVIFQDKAAKKIYHVNQINSDVLRKMRYKHLNVMVHIYGTAISSRAIHTKMCAAIIQPSQNVKPEKADGDSKGSRTDRSNTATATSTYSTVTEFGITDLVRKLKEKHGNHLIANTSSWTMWANAIHSAPGHKQANMVKDVPPSHLVHLFRSIPAENEVKRSVQNSLQIVGNLNDSYSQSLKILREEFDQMKEATLRAFDLYERRLQATEDMLSINASFATSIDNALQVEVNAESIVEEHQLTNMPDLDYD